MHEDHSMHDVKKQGTHTRRRILRRRILVMAASGIAGAAASAAIPPFWRHARQSAGTKPSGVRADRLEGSDSSNAQLKRILHQYGSEFGDITRIDQKTAST